MKHFFIQKNITLRTFEVLDIVRNFLMFCVTILIGINIIGTFNKNLTVIFSIILLILSTCLLTLGIFLLSVKIKD